MPLCLIALGSNLGDRAATLDAAVDVLANSPEVQLIRHSQWRSTLPVGGDGAQREFLNGAALVETSLDAATLYHRLQQIELKFGRERHERWAARTLDLDLLLHGDAIIDSPDLVVPHPRMSFRRFVLEPAAEIAGTFVHPTIGWTLGQLLCHLEEGSDCAAIITPQESARRALTAQLAEHCGCRVGKPSFEDDTRWPTAWTTWLMVPGSTANSRPPKLTVLVDPPAANAGWNELVRQTGRGPTLRIFAADVGGVEQEALAAIEAVWFRLGPSGRNRLQ